MIEQRVLALLLAFIALSHVYLIYPLPSARVQEIAQIESRKNQQSVASDPTKSSSTVTEEELRASLGLDALEKSLWKGWIIAITIVILGSASASVVWKLRSPWWHVVALIVCIAYLITFWVESVPPLQEVSDFLEFQAKTISSLMRLGHIDRLLMLVQQLLAPVVVLIIGVYVAMRISKATKR